MINQARPSETQGCRVLWLGDVDVRSVLCKMRLKSRGREEDKFTPDLLGLAHF